MKFQIDHDYHIHSTVSSCCHDPEQTTERILQYAKDNGLRRIILTDHYWDETVPDASDWYRKQGFSHISQALPLPQADGIEFLFGCETDMNKDMTIGIPPERWNDFSFVLIPTTHLHMVGFTLPIEEENSHEARAAQWVKRFEALLDMSLPFDKMGIPHLTCGLFDRRSREDFLHSLGLVSNDDMERLFAKAATLGCGIELNQHDMSFSDAETDAVLRPYRIAKSYGCKFFLGSDAHSPSGFRDTQAIFERAVDLLDLSEADKFQLA